MKNCDNLEMALDLLQSLHDTMVSIGAAGTSQMVPATTLIAFDTVIEKVQALLKEVKEGEEEG